MRRKFNIRLVLLFAVVSLAGLLTVCVVRMQQQSRLDGALIAEIKAGRPAQVAFLLGHGADANSTEIIGEGPSIMQILQRVLHGSASKNPLSALGINLKTALENNSYGDPGKGVYDTIAVDLIEHGASCHIEVDACGTPVHCAARAGLTNTLKLLLSTGSSPNTLDINGRTPLMDADEESTSVLLHWGANPNIGTLNGYSILDHACQEGEGSIERVRLLLAAGANPNARDESGFTPLMYTTVPETAYQLLHYGADVNATDSAGQTVLFKAIKSTKLSTPDEHAKLIRLLKQYGAQEKLTSAQLP